jgi:hypothetical protein
MLTVVAQVPVLEIATEGGFRPQNAVCRIRGVGDHRWREGVPRWSVQCASGRATCHGRCGLVGMAGLGACIK